jgi:NAD(P)-dependent dehydrogenase (short-subunit alcohol dehydrogenase family)
MTGPKVWFVTGASRGFGREWTSAALERGDCVTATVREPRALDDLSKLFPETLLVVRLDVTRSADVRAAVAATLDRFGRIDVVVNNAGYGVLGMVEEISEEQARAQMEVNFFGALWVTQAVLPVLRDQGAGHILQVSSIGGICSFPGVGLYHASKWALEGLSDSLAQEVEGLGVKVTLLEPAIYATDWGSLSADRAKPLTSYDEARERAAPARAERGAKPGAPSATRAPLLHLVDMDSPPRRVFLGENALGLAQAEYAERMRTWVDWQWFAEWAHGDRPVSSSPS